MEIGDEYSNIDRIKRRSKSAFTINLDLRKRLNIHDDFTSRYCRIYNDHIHKQRLRSSILRPEHPIGKDFNTFQ